MNKQKRNQLGNIIPLMNIKNMIYDIKKPGNEDKNIIIAYLTKHCGVQR